LRFKDIVLQHLKKIGTLASVELRGGYWEEKPVVSGGGIITTKTYVPDSREIYSNAVEYFADILYPHFDKEMKEVEEEAEALIEESYKHNTTADSKGDRIFSSMDNKAIFRERRVLINRKLFRELCSFLYRRKYLELGTVED
jgi:hypothetical protein